MKIIVEGCDRTGKTTFCQYLLSKYPKMSYIHCNKDDEKNYDFYLGLLKKQLAVHDRNFVGEMVYPEVYNRTGELSLSEFEKLVKYCNENGIEILVLYDDSYEILKRSEHEPKEIQNNIVKINTQFQKLASQYGLKLRTLKEALNEY